MESNPYTPPEVQADTSDSSPSFDRRYLFLLLPPLVPFAVHIAVRIFIASSETLYHALFTLGAIIPAWMWSLSMIERLRLSFWKSYFLACGVCGTVLVTAIVSPKLLDWIVG